MIQAGDLRNGRTFVMDDDVWVVEEFHHSKHARGSAIVRLKIRSIMNGVGREITVNPTQKFEGARIESKKMQYLYNDGNLYYFMDNETYEQIPVEKSAVEDAILYLKENDDAELKFYEGKVFRVDAPNFVVREVTETEPGVRGDTASGANKPAVIETGATIQVPLFVNKGDNIRIDTRTGTYMSREN